MLRYNQACFQGHCEDFFRLAISPKNIFQDSGKAADKYVYGYGLAFQSDSHSIPIMPSRNKSKSEHNDLCMIDIISCMI